MALNLVTNHDIRTRYNSLFHSLKIAKLEKEIQEMYHLNTTVTMFDYHLGRMYISGVSVEDTAISIIEKKERIETLMKKHKRYLSMHERALKNIKRKSKLEIILGIYQTKICTYDEIAEVMGLSKERIRQILDVYKQELTKIILEEETLDDNEVMTEAEVQELSEAIEYNATYEPKKLPRSTDPLHGIVEWQKEQNLKVKHKPKISNFR